MHIRQFLLLGVIGVSSTAAAYSSGMTNMSGKTTATCNNCHYGGEKPTVTLSGPTTVLPGSTNTYRLTLTGGAAKVGGVDVAVDNASATLVPGAGMRAITGELTHASPQEFSNGTLSIDFALRAPSQEGKVKLYATGNSANGDRSPGGDGAASTTLDVTVSAAPPPPAPTPPTPTPGTPPTTGGNPSNPGATPAPGTPSPEPVIEDPSGEPTGGCTAAGGALAPVLLLGWTATLLRRRRQARS
jgi:hypothetical protein